MSIFFTIDAYPAHTLCMTFDPFQGFNLDLIPQTYCQKLLIIHLYSGIIIIIVIGNWKIFLTWWQKHYLVADFFLFCFVWQTNNTRATNSSSKNRNQTNQPMVGKKIFIFIYWWKIHIFGAMKFFCLKMAFFWWKCVQTKNTTNNKIV